MTLRTGGPVVATTAFLAMTLSLRAFAQQAPQASPAAPPPLVIQVGLDLIQIDASVTDKSGRPVTDLRPEDFTLEVDGRQQPITNAAFFGRSPLPAKGAGADSASDPTEGSAADCTVVFIIDDLNMSFRSMYLAREALKRFAVEIDSTRPLVGLRLSSDALDRFSLHRSPARFASAASALGYNIRSSKGILNRPADSVSAPTPTEAALNLEQRAYSLVATIDSLRGIPGRKAVVFVSEGFWVDNRVHGQLDASFAFSSLFEDSNVSAALRMITEVANRASVVLYTVDPRGLAVDFPDVADNVTSEQAGRLMRERRDERMGSQATLQYLADDTGGLAVANRNDLQGGFGDVIKDQGAYYLLGFEPPEKTFVRSSGRPKFHKVKLSVSRKGVRVRTRAGFYGVTDDEVAKRAPATVTPEF